MAGSSVAPEKCYHVRSISMPSTSHPLTLKIEEDLGKLQIWKTLSTSSSSLSASMICVGLSGLKDLYDHVEDLLRLPQTQQVLLQHRHEKCVEEILEGSIRLLDMCGTTRDILSIAKESVQDLQCALRRKGDFALENKVGVYISSRKKVKDIAKCLGGLKRMRNKGALSPLLLKDQHLSMVVRVLTEVKDVTFSIFQSTLSFMSVSRPKQKHSSWSLVSKLMHKGLVACEGEQKAMGEVESVDVALNELCGHVLDKEADRERAQNEVQKQLEALEVTIGSVDGELECMFRCLIHTRVSLLNILTH